MLKEFYRRFKKHRLGLTGAIIIIILFLVALFAPFLAPSDPQRVDLGNTLAPLSLKHPLGTDHLGRDLLSRVIYGTRIALIVGIGSVGIAALFGGLAGLCAGYFGKVTDATVMRSLDVVWAFPPILLALALVAVRGASLSTVVFSIAIVGIPGHARIVRSSVLSIKEKTYIMAARASGINHWKILISHILPNVLAPVIVVSTLGIATSVMIEATLSFLGLGMQSPNDSWGLMISEGQKYLRTYPYYSLFPGIMIMVIVFAFNVFGDGLRDAWDPKLKT
jgi:peptide/nickel transport system permease protein